MGVVTYRWEAWAEAHAAPHGQGADRLLDVGCGVGTSVLAALGDRGRVVVAVDPSPNHLERLRCVFVSIGGCRWRRSLI